MNKINWIMQYYKKQGKLYQREHKSQLPSRLLLPLEVNPIQYKNSAQIGQYIFQFLQKRYPFFQKVKKSVLYQKIQYIIRNRKFSFKPSLMVIYGSAVNGFSTKISDIDATLIINQAFNERNVLEELADVFEQYNFKVERITFYKVRVKNIQIYYCGQKVDITVNNYMGIFNSVLLRAYATMSPQVRVFCIFIKQWANKQNLINIKQFSSYSVILMAIHYLQRRNKIPVLRQENDPSGQIYMKLPKFKDGIIRICHKTGVILKKPFNIHTQLKGFAQYYDSFIDSYERVNIKRNQPTFKKNLQKDYLISIIDPYDPTYNPGRWLMKNYNGQLRRQLLKLSKFVDQLEKSSSKYSVQIGLKKYLQDNIIN